MGLKRSDEFRGDAVCTALSNGLTRKQVADDLDLQAIPIFILPWSVWGAMPAQPIPQEQGA